MLSRLNQDYAIPELVSFRLSPAGVIIMEIDNDFAQASLSLSGGQLLSWQPKDQAEPVIWLSEQAVIAPGKSIRGGVPVCWPWFGAHPSASDVPNHGYARTSEWQVTETCALENGETEVELVLIENDESKRLWPHDTPLSLRLTVGQSLNMSLTTHNKGDEEVILSEALHTYFHISDIGEISISGLSDTDYLDKVEDFARKTQQGDIQFSGETDRVYIHSDSECTLHDPSLKRRIHIEKSSSASTIVWSPWTEKAHNMGDLGENNGWRRMVCVESGNALENTLKLPAGQSHTLNVRYFVSDI